jgi:capsular exopolysaccharide synthesis family protein
VENKELPEMMFEPVTQAPASGAKSIASLEDYIEAVRRRKALVILTTLLALALSVWMASNRTKEYRTGSSVVVSPTPVGSTSLAPVAPNLERETALLLSDEIGQAARTTAGTGIGRVTASFKPASDVIGISATSTNPSYAAALATAYANEYVNRRLAAQKAFYTLADKQVTDELDLVNKRITDAEAQMNAFDQRRILLGLAPAGEAKTKELEAIAVDRNQFATNVAQDQYRVRTLETSLTDSRKVQVTQLPAAAVISAANVPSTPVGLRAPVLWLAGGLLGLALGIVAAFTRERLDRRASASRDVELALGGRVLGSIPPFGFRSRSGKWALVMANDKTGAAAQRARESYRRLRSSVQFLSRGEKITRIVVTSNQPYEGKSTTSANLALSLALGGTRVALVSADLRRSSLERTFGIDNERGLSSFLNGSTDVLRQERIDGFEDFVLVPSGPEPANPGELLGSVRFVQAMEWLSKDFEIVIVDTPPLSAAADALAAANSCDGMVIVVDGNRTETTDLLAIRNQIDRSGNKLLGAVLNRDTSNKTSWFHRRDRYGYYSDGPVAKPGGQVREPAATEFVTR